MWWERLLNVIDMLQEYQRRWGRRLGVVGSLSFNVQGRGWSCPIWTHSDRQKKGRGGGVQKLGIFHGCHKCMVLLRKGFEFWDCFYSCHLNSVTFSFLSKYLGHLAGSTVSLSQLFYFSVGGLCEKFACWLRGHNIFSVSDQGPDLAIQELRKFMFEKSRDSRPVNIVSW